MSSFCTSALASLDSSLAPLCESLETLNAAKSVELSEVINQLTSTSESARIVRELISLELPGASWESREELEALIEQIQTILDARTLRQLRSRLLLLATELEHGSLVHRRAHRLNELHRLREQAIEELRAQAEREATPQTLPGPQADQWIEWACGLKEPQDAEALQTLRNGFAHLDDFVANLESNMWIPAAPTPENPAAAQESVDKIQPGPFQKTEQLRESVVPSQPSRAKVDGISPNDNQVARTLIDDPLLNWARESQASHGTSAAQAEVAVPALALRSLDDSLNPLRENLETLKAAKSVELAEVIDQLTKAAESARVVRELISSELPDAVWQNREEVEILIEKVKTISDERTLEQLRSRLMLLATELERGSIVHRRAHRVSELLQLREQAIEELRAQAGPEAMPPTLPGPQADQWIEWACDLKEPQDAEALQTLRSGFAHLDDFVANLEANMWVPQGSPTREIPLAAWRPLDKTQPAQLHQKTNEFTESVVSADPTATELEGAKSAGECAEPRFLESLPERAVESNTLTPNDATPTVTEEELARILSQERALLAGMMGIVRDPVGHFNRPLGPITEKVFVSDPIAQFNRPVQHSSTEEALAETNAEIPSAGSEIAAIAIDEKTTAEEPSSDKWRALLATPAVLVVAALLVTSALGALVWRSYRNSTSNGPVQAMERKVPDPASSGAGNQGSVQPTAATSSVTPVSETKVPTQTQSKPQDQSLAPGLLSSAMSTRQASDRDNRLLRSDVSMPGGVAATKRTEAPSDNTADVTSSIPGGLPNEVPASVASIVGGAPAAVPKVAAQPVRVSSGVTQGLLVHQVSPRYPTEARQTGIQGKVVLQALIAKDGTVQSLHVLSGPSGLTKAAVDAVKQWRYKPYTLNGEPVEAATQIIVNFSLGAR